MSKPETTAMVRPQFLPTAPPPSAETPNYQVPIMARFPEQPPLTVPQVKRLTVPDIERVLAWAVPHLKQKHFPRLNDEMFVAWLRANLGSPSLMILATEEAFGIAEAHSDLFEPRIEVREHFVVGTKKGQMEMIYREFARWAKAVNALRLVMGAASDANMDRLKDIMRCDEMQVLMVLNIKAPQP